ncbi:MAG: Rnase Y domain-containing protein, partial [Patescibacteria group bacterium]
MGNLTSAAFGLIFVIGGIGILLGVVAGYFLRKKIAKIQVGTLESELNRKIEESKSQVKEILLSAKEESVKIIGLAKKEEKEREDKLLKLEERLAHREDMLDKKMDNNEKLEKDLVLKAEKVKMIREEVEQIKNAQVGELEKISGYTKDQAKDELFKSAEKLYSDDILARIKKIEKDGVQELERKANDLLATAIQRYASSQVSEVTTTTVTIPSDEMKGKIIGKEGRNIKALERFTGAEIIVDDTPGTII